VLVFGQKSAGREAGYGVTRAAGERRRGLEGVDAARVW
jgi:hypothetical protein